MEVLLAAVGTILLLFGLFGLFAGATPFLIYAHIGGALGLIVFAGLRRGAALGDFFARDATRGGASALVQAGVLIAIAGMVAYISVRNPVHWDFTESGLHTLAEGSKTTLAQIPEARDQHVEILGFFTKGNDGAVRNTLEMYTYASDRIGTSVVDPNERPDLALRHEIRAEGVLVVCGGPCSTAKGTVKVTEVTEEAITRAIRSVISSKRKVYFLTGHGEPALDDETAAGIALARQALEDENIVVESLLLANAEKVPEDADAVALVGANHSVFERELVLLDDYLQGGGGVLLLADPLVISNVESRARSWGVELGDDVVVEEQLQLFSGPTLGVQPIVTSYGNHPITEKIGSQPTLFRLARSVSAADGSDLVELALTSEHSWAESDTRQFSQPEPIVQRDPATDRIGPVALAAAREVGDQNGRLVVVGDSDFARNRYLYEFFNRDFFLNSVNWLVGESAFISIERKAPRASQAALTVEQFGNLRFLALFALPELILLAGLMTWYRNRT